MNKNGNSQRRGSVVVGIDGSPGASTALRWAATEARLRKGRLVVVHARTPVYMDPLLVGPLTGFTTTGLTDMRRAAEAMLEKAIAYLNAEGIEIEYRVDEGGAAEVLVAAAAEADLLVVGSRGHGGFTGLLLGSVSQQCAHHTPCPIVIVHGAKPAARASRQPLRRHGSNAGDRLKGCQATTVRPRPPGSAGPSAIVVSASPLRCQEGADARCPTYG